MKFHLGVVARYPVTWIAALVVVLIEWQIFTWFDPPLPIAIALVVLGVLSLAAWPIVMLASGKTDQLRYTPDELVGDEPIDPDTLKAELLALDHERGVHQIDMLRSKTDNLATILGQRLEAGELTFSRYLATAERVYAAALGNLQQVAIMLRSISAIDPDYIETRMKELENGGVVAMTEVATLRSRLKLLTDQKVKIDELMSENEVALTTLDRTTAALADAKIGAKALDAKSAMTDLEELAARAGRYAED